MSGVETIVLTDGESRATLAAARSLGAAGHRVHVVSERGRSLAGASRFVASEVAVGDPGRCPQAWAEAVSSVAAEVGATVVWPVTELAHEASYAAGLDRALPLLAPDRDAYRAAVDKAGLVERARALGLEAPTTVVVAGVADLHALPDGIGYPAVVKPRRSVFAWGPDGAFRQGVARVLRDPTDLDRARRDPGLAGEVLVQPFVPGHGEAVFLLCRDGETRVHFAHRRLREKPPSGGQSVLRESIPTDPALLAASERLLAELRFTGVAMVEFRRTPDGRASLMEINPRLWGSLQLAIDAGVDFPRLMLALFRGEDPPATPARAGVRTRWLLGDLDHLLICLRRPALRRELGVGVGGLLLNFARSFVDGTRHEIARRGDWRPFARDLAAWWRD